MKNYIYKSVMRTSLGFMTIIIYCMISMIIKFSYLYVSSNWLFYNLYKIC